MVRSKISTSWILLAAILVSFCFSRRVASLDLDSAMSSTARVPSRLPLAFVENRGQWGTDADFVCWQGTALARFTPRSMTFQVHERRDGDRAVGVVFRMSFDDSCESTSIETENRLRTVYNFLKGSNPKKWRRRVPSFGSLVYRGLYPGIDLRVRPARTTAGGAGGFLEYDLLLAPGADASRISITCEGVDGLRVGEDGRLEMITPLGVITHSPPLAWYETPEGERRSARCCFRLTGPRSFGFAVEGPDPGLRLVIDPVLELAAWFGGFGSDWANGVVRTADRRIVLGGGTGSSFEIIDAVGAIVAGMLGDVDAFVIQMTPEGDEVEVWTLIGGAGTERVYSLALSDSGKIVACGYTESFDFPTTADAFESTFGGNRDVFVLRLDESGEELEYSTFLGGRVEETSPRHAFGVDRDGRFYVAGSTSLTCETFERCP